MGTLAALNIYYEGGQDEKGIHGYLHRVGSY
jgi:hypothetical protein